jgi:phosphatidylserine/phosphatidylglycerophosphate/cardiolipin synthase-like enzyme
MKKQMIIICLLITLTVMALEDGLRAAPPEFSVKTPVQVCFSPDGGCSNLLVQTITQARSEILVMVYSFRSVPIAQALITAHKAGVNVELLMDKSERQEGFTPATMVNHAGIPVWLDAKHAAMNNRVMIIDGEIVVTGSFNFNSASEEMNAENLIILQSTELAKRYRDNWLNHRKHSETN